MPDLTGSVPPIPARHLRAIYLENPLTDAEIEQLYAEFDTARTQHKIDAKAPPACNSQTGGAGRVERPHHGVEWDASECHTARSSANMIITIGFALVALVMFGSLVIFS